jgi:pyruvate/2-oxoacid:ferredoxin oxidoreductase alpha subunit
MYDPTIQDPNALTIQNILSGVSTGAGMVTASSNGSAMTVNALRAAGELNTSLVVLDAMSGRPSPAQTGTDYSITLNAPELEWKKSNTPSAPQAIIGTSGTSMGGMGR